MPKGVRLLPKEKGFVKDYIETGNGTEAVARNYDVKNRNVASVMANENLAKPKIQKAIAEILNDELLSERHLQLLNSTRMDHMVFPLGPVDDEEKKQIDDSLEEAKLPQEYKERTTLTDKEIKDMLAEVNCIVRRIVHGDHARHVYFWARDNRALKDGLDMAYKIKGTYAPEKHQSVNVNVDITPKRKQLLDEYEGKIKESLTSEINGE